MQIAGKLSHLPSGKINPVAFYLSLTAIQNRSSLTPQCVVSPNDLRRVKRIRFIAWHTRFYFFDQFSVFNPLILLKWFSLFVTSVKFNVSAVDAINKSKSSIGEPDFCRFAFNWLNVSMIALSISIIGNNSFIR